MNRVVEGGGWSICTTRTFLLTPHPWTSCVRAACRGKVEGEAAADECMQMRASVAPRARRRVIKQFCNFYFFILIKITKTCFFSSYNSLFHLDKKIRRDAIFLFFFVKVESWVKALARRHTHRVTFQSPPQGGEIFKGRERESVALRIHIHSSLIFIWASRTI